MLPTTLLVIAFDRLPRVSIPGIAAAHDASHNPGFTELVAEVTRSTRGPAELWFTLG